MEKITITITDENGISKTYQPKGSLSDLIMDAFVEADYQDEHWRDEDTVHLIIQKLKGESPITYLNN